MSDEVDIIGLAYEDARREAVQLKGGYIKTIAPAKVNLYLAVGEKRADGYHEVENVMQTLLLHDTVYLRSVPAEAYAIETGQPVAEGITIHLTCSGSEHTALDIPAEKNLVYKAVMMLAEATHQTDSMVLDIHVEKKIPNQAGMGGGSSDAAAALVAAARAWGIAPDAPEIEACAKKLGADVAFFLRGGCALYNGVGGDFVRTLPSRKDAVLLVKPAAGCSTAAIYQEFDAAPCLPEEATVAAMEAAEAGDQVPFFNGLAPVAEKLVPEIAEVRVWLEEQPGVTLAMVTGSGSAVYALCEDRDQMNLLFTEAKKRGLWAATSFFLNVKAACK